MSRIPKIIHYIFALDDSFENKDWSLIHYACVRSAIDRLKPDAVYVYITQEPGGPWWELTRPFVQLRTIEPPSEIFGRPLMHPAHKADVIRLGILREHGGIYLDIDVFAHKSFDDLLDHSTVMGLQGPDGVYGLDAAVILAEPHAPFLERWYHEYEWFRGRGRQAYWAEHSCIVPFNLSKDGTGDITVLDDKAFFWPLWTREGIELLYEAPSPEIDRLGFANHLWESKVWVTHLEFLTPGDVRRRDCLFNRWVRPYVEDLPDSFGAPTLRQKAKRWNRIGRKAARYAVWKTGLLPAN